MDYSDRIGVTDDDQALADPRGLFAKAGTHPRPTPLSPTQALDAAARVTACPARPPAPPPAGTRPPGTPAAGTVPPPLPAGYAFA